METKKAQSAIEYILLYGWVILIILIVISLLFFSGLLETITTPENRAVGFATIKVNRFDFVSNEDILFTIQNTADLELQISDIKFKNETLGNIAFPFNISPGQQLHFTGKVSEEFFEGEIIRNAPLGIIYKISGGTTIRTESGVLSGKVI